jgi:hypothetical protein
VDYCTRCWHQRDCCCTGKVPEPEPVAENEGENRKKRSKESKSHIVI